MNRFLQSPLVRRMVAVLAWCALAFIAYATLSPIEQRPVVTGIKIEHFMAFAVTGCLFGIAYPKRWPWLLAILAGSAIILEVLQHFVPGRHGRVVDLAFKQTGIIVGFAIATFINRMRAPPQP
jgi:VanZ family protein